MKKMAGCTAVLAFLLALSLAACGEDSPETMLASAKDYLAKNDAKAAAIQLKNALQGRPNLAEARFLLGKVLLDEGDVSGADAELRKAAELEYPADRVLPLQARAMLLLGQPKKVIDDFARKRLTDPASMAELQTTVGNAYLTQNDLTKAQKFFAAARSSAPGYAPSLVGEARVKAARRDVRGALALADSALEKDPRLHDASQLKGNLLALEGRTGEAIALYRAVLEQKPDYLPAYVSLITHEMASGRLDEAASRFEEMRRIAPGNPQTAYLRAELLYRQKRFTEAREAAQLLLRMLPDSVSGQQLAGAIEFELKSYFNAERYLQSVLPKVSRTGVARRLLIAAYLRSGQPDKALGVLEPVLNEVEEDANWLALAGEVFLQNGEIEKAGAYFVEAAALDPEDQSKQTAVALFRLASGQTDAAYAALERIASTDPGIRADMALIASQLQSRRFDEALQSIDGLAGKRGDDPLVAPLVDNLRGAALLGKRDMDGARQNFESALRKSPEYFPALRNLARLDLAAGRPEEAKKRFEDMLARNPKSSLALLALAELEARTGAGMDRVAALIGKAVAANPTDLASRLALINFYLGAREAGKAVAAARDALTLLPDNPALIDAEGRALQAAGSYNQALANYTKLSETNPAAVQPYLRMAEIHLAAKNPGAAMQSLRKALSIQPDSIEALRGTIMLDLEAGRASNAVATARDMQRRFPKNPIGFLLEGDVHVQDKAWKEAVNAYQILLKEQPDNPMLLNRLAWVMARNKNPKAIGLAERAYALAPDQVNIVDTLGSLLAEKGDFKRGLELLRRACALAPNDPVIRFKLAAALVKAGNPAEAKPILIELSMLGDRFARNREVAELLRGIQ